MLGTESRNASDVLAGIQAPNGRSSMEDMVAKTQTPLQRIALVALGWIVMLVGIAGLFLPVLPGVFLVVAGALLLSPRSAWLRRLDKCRARFLVIDRAFKRFSVWVERAKLREERSG